MSEVNINFSLDGANTVIQCHENDSMKDIFTKFLNKSMIDSTNLYCIYGAKVLDAEFNKTFLEIANEQDKKEKKMNIVVTRNPTAINNNFYIISKNIICPTCKEICEFEFNNNYTISLMRCKNGHIKENIPLNEFEECQKINISDIICEECKENNKGSVKNNEFYRCLDCKINLCPLCKSKHEKEDDYVINHDRIIFNCMTHKVALTKYCKNCKLNICDSCKEEHKNHEFIDFNEINLDKKQLKNELNENQKIIDQLDNLPKEIEKIFQKVKENFQLACEIKKRILDNYCIHRRTYQVLMNLKRDRENNIVLKDLQGIANQDNIIQKFINVLKIYGKIVSSDNDYFTSFENEIKELKKENQKLKEMNSQLKIENEELCKSLGNQNISIKKLEREKDKLENQYIMSKKISTEMENERQKYQNNLMEKEKLILDLQKDNEKKSKELFIKIKKEKDMLEEQKRLERENFIETERLNKKIKELEENNSKNKDDDDDDDKYEMMNQKLSLIQKIIDYGINSITLNDYYNKPGNKCLLIDLVLSKQNYLTSEDVAMTMLEVDRSDFVPKNPYQNKPQTVGFELNIPAPYMHSLALEHLKDYCTEDSKILDLDSGTGYLTCALARLTNYKGTVIGVEYNLESILLGKNNIKKNHANLINKNIFFVESDEINEFKKYGPFTAIHVGYVVEEIPDEFIDLLDYNGRMFILVGEKGESPKITIVDKDILGECTFTEI